MAFLYYYLLFIKLKGSRNSRWVINLRQIGAARYSAELYGSAAVFFFPPRSFFDSCDSRLIVPVHLARHRIELESQTTNLLCNNFGCEKLLYCDSGWADFSELSARYFTIENEKFSVVKTTKQKKNRLKPDRVWCRLEVILKSILRVHFSFIGLDQCFSLNNWTE